MTLNLQKMGWVSLALAAGLFVGCKKGGGQQAAPAQDAPVVAVTPVQQQEIVEWTEFTGRTAATENVEVRPRVSGHIEAVKFKPGALVKKGDVLFEIDARWYQATYDHRAAEFESARVKTDNAEREAKRTTQLLADKAISTEEADQRRARFEEANAMLQAAKAARDAAKLDLEYTVVRSPIDGRVSRELVTVGNMVSGTPGGATLLTTVVSVDAIHVYADVDENSLLRFNALARAGKLASNGDGQIPVQLQLADESDFPHAGRIESFDNKLDPQTGSIVLRSIFPNPDGRIVPGLFARIRIPASAKHPAVLIEETAVGTDQAQKFVLAVSSSNTAAYRAVKLGPIVNGKRLVREGLEPGEQIVQNIIMARVRPGMPIQPQQAAATNEGTIQTAQRKGDGKSAL
jgi:RND family efflux transporter MFP subunit